MRNRQSSPSIAIYVESKAVIGSRIGYDAVKRLVAPVDLLNSLVVLAKVCWMLESWTGDLVELQVELSKIFLNRYLQTIERILQGKKTFVFFKPQILSLMKLILLHSVNKNKDLGILDEDQRRKIGLGLLGISDEIIHQYKLKSKKHEKRGRVDQVAIELVLSSFHIKSMRTGLTLVRTTQLYTEIGKRLKNDIDYLDIEEVFFLACGITINEYISFAILIWAHYSTAMKPNSFPDKPDSIYLQPSKLFLKTKVEQEVLTKIFDLLSTDLEPLREDLQKQTKREVIYDFLPFKSNPLIKFQEDLYLPISVQFLIEKVTTGVYWIIFDHLKQTDENTHSMFMRYYGKLFQIYVEDILEQILKRGKPDQQLVFKDVPYKIGKKEHRSSDLIINIDDNLIFVEVSAGRLQAKKTMALGQSEAFEQDIEKMVLKKAGQLQKCISHLKEGKFKLDGVEINKIRNFYPIIVSYEGIPKHPAIHAFLTNKLNAEELFRDDDIAELSLMDIEDLEEIEGYSEFEFFQILKEWLSDKNYTHFSIRDYLKRNYRGSEMRSDWFQKITNKIFNDATMLFFGKELDAE